MTREYLYVYLKMNLNTFELVNNNLFKNVLKIAYTKPLKDGWCYNNIYNNNNTLF